MIRVVERAPCGVGPIAIDRADLAGHRWPPPRLHDRRGRGSDLAWAHRLLLPRGDDTLSERGRARLDEVLAHNDPTQEIGAAWGVKGTTPTA